MRRTCKQCGQTFYLNQSEINFYKSKNLTLPRRCKECRKANKQQKTDEKTVTDTTIEIKEAKENKKPANKRKFVLIGIVIAIIIAAIIYAAAIWSTKQYTTLPLEINLNVLSYKDGIVTAELVNNSGYEMEYGNEYYLQQLVDGKWIDVQPIKEYTTNGEIQKIKDLTTVKLQYDLSIFGDLKPGQYKLLKTDLEAPFEIK